MKKKKGGLFRKFDGVSKRRVVKYIIIAFFVIWAISSIYAKFLPLPDGISVEGPIYNVSGVDFMYDLNYIDGEEQIIEQEIFDEIFRISKNQ